MLLLPKRLWEQVVANCLDCLPLEACGLLAGRPWRGRAHVPTSAGPAPRAAAQAAGAAEEDRALRAGEGPEVEGWAEVCEAYPAHNAACSARLYDVEPRDLLRADRAAEAAGLSLVGVWHSHTHTEAYPSPTDVARAPDPAWHYVLVSLRDSEPVLRSYRITGNEIAEETVVLSGSPPCSWAGADRRGAPWPGEITPPSGRAKQHGPRDVPDGMPYHGDKEGQV